MNKDNPELLLTSKIDNQFNINFTYEQFDILVLNKIDPSTEKLNNTRKLLSISRRDLSVTIEHQHRYEEKINGVSVVQDGKFFRIVYDCILASEDQKVTYLNKKIN